MSLSHLLIRIDPGRRYELLALLATQPELKLQPVFMLEHLMVDFSPADVLEERDVIGRITLLPGVRSVSLTLPLKTASPSVD